MPIILPKSEIEETSNFPIRVYWASATFLDLRPRVVLAVWHLESFVLFQREIWIGKNYLKYSGKLSIMRIMHFYQIEQLHNLTCYCSFIAGLRRVYLKERRRKKAEKRGKSLIVGSQHFSALKQLSTTPFIQFWHQTNSSEFNEENDDVCVLACALMTTIKWKLFLKTKEFILPKGV